MVSSEWFQLAAVVTIVGAGLAVVRSFWRLELALQKQLTELSTAISHLADVVLDIRKEQRLLLRDRERDVGRREALAATHK